MHTEEIIDKFSACLTTMFREKHSACINDLPGASKAVIASALQRTLGKTALLISDGHQSLETIHRDAVTICPVTNPDNLPIYFPARESPVNAEQDHDIMGHRLYALYKLLKNNNKTIIITSIQSLMQKVPNPDSLHRHTISLTAGQEINMDHLITLLTKSGYEFTRQVVEKKQACLRGGIIDAWPISEPWPFRIEFFGSTIESIRTFDPASQQSVEHMDNIMLLPCSEYFDTHTGKTVSHSDSLLSYLPPDTIFVWPDFDSIREHARNYEETTAEPDTTEIIRFETIFSQIESMKDARQLFAGSYSQSVTNPNLLHINAIHGIAQLSRNTFDPDITEQSRIELLSNLAKYAARGFTVAFFFDTQGSLDHFANNLPTLKNSKSNIFSHLVVGCLSQGFISESANLIIIAESDLYGRRKTDLTRYKPITAQFTPSFRLTKLPDIKPGDLVIHIEHGLGRYIGINEIMFNGQPQESLTVEYADNAKLHVPIFHIHLLSKYIGISKPSTRLHRLGGRRWNNEKSAAEKSIHDLASSLLETQAQRNVLAGYSFSRDSKWQYEFEKSFPYRETPDQNTVITAVKANMESTRPMDRLVCGDAGYGKTEIAMRAAFKAVMDHKQVAVLVPTTVLAQQHFDTFTERMIPYPVRVEMLSRFCTPTQSRTTINDLKTGAVDIVIGTHALLQPGIHFNDLGLVMIDEEQRFGVSHKEQLKQLRKLVDVLTLTATPIPRTLYMAMTGVKEMSLLQTPPGERMAIETIVIRNDDTIVREAIRRELRREGQVFYLHNRILTIERVRHRLQKLIPEARIAVAHGRMNPSELSTTMESFVNGEYDILLSTTIIESGMDIPRANTILIDRSDRFGIADLYQLRGRVGRSNRKAYAYLLLPAQGQIDPAGRARINAIKAHSGLGASFELALQDLELRGAGNLLGTQQSGHINAIGFGLYCQLLKRTIARQKGEHIPKMINVETYIDFIDFSRHPGPIDNSAVIPANYIQDEQQRIGIYRKIAESSTLQDLVNLNDELNDRFGPIPPSCARLLNIARLRIAASGKGIQKIEVRDNKVMLTRDNTYLKDSTKFPRISGTSPDKSLNEIFDIIQAI